MSSRVKTLPAWVATVLAIIAIAGLLYNSIQLTQLLAKPPVPQEVLQDLEDLKKRMEDLNTALEGLKSSQQEIREEIERPKILYALKDALGRLVVVVPKGAPLPPGIPEDAVVVRTPAERIVSFAPSITATLFTIGIGERVVAVTKWDEWPEEVVKKKEAGEVVVLESIVEPEVEKIVGTDPDIIITIKLSPEKIKVFEDLGIPVVVVDYGDSIEDILKAIILIGRVVGAEEGAKGLAEKIRNDIDAVAEKVKGRPKVKVFWLVWHEPLMTAGGPSFITALLEAAGGENVFKDVDTAWPIISREEVLARNPEVIIFTEGFREQGIKGKEDLLALFPEWKDVDAIKNDKVFIVPDAAVQPGPRTPEMVELIAGLLHPDVFMLLVLVYAYTLR